MAERNIVTVFDENDCKWRNAKQSITERGISMFSNDLLSDVSLVVRGSRNEDEPKAKKSKIAIPAHKVVLSICSPVFFAMFCGELAERSDSIDLLDCEYEGVMEMLRYMYSGKAEINENNVMQVLYVTKKYLVDSLADECVLFLREKLDPSNVFCVLSHALQYDEKVLVDQCWEVIDRETEEALKSEGFETIQRSLLEAVVKRDTLTATEIDLFKAVDLWATKECYRQGLSADGSVKRRILSETVIQLIRFPVMDQKDFSSYVLDSKILTPQEVDNIFTSPVGFHGNKRVGTLLSCFRFRYLEDIYSMHFKQPLCLYLDKDIVLHGIRLIGSENTDYAATLMVKEKDGDVIVKKSGTFSSVVFYKKQFRYYGYDVMFDPVNLSKDVYYLIKAKITGPHQSVCGERQDYSEVKVRNVTFFLWSYKEYCGQFPEFWFKLP